MINGFEYQKNNIVLMSPEQPHTVSTNFTTPEYVTLIRPSSIHHSRIVGSDPKTKDLVYHSCYSNSTTKSWNKIML